MTEVTLLKDKFPSYNDAALFDLAFKKLKRTIVDARKIV